MSTPTSLPATPPVLSGRPSKSNKQSKVVVVKLSSHLLEPFLPKPLPRKDSKSSQSTSFPSTPKEAPTAPSETLHSSNENPSESNSTPIPSNDQTVLTDLPRRPGTKGLKPGLKRGFGQGVDGIPKPRGKPGPKKKPRLEDGTIDHGVKTSFSGVAPISSHKLGPKANQGQINAGLRALDRSGRPCRKWERKPLQLKSFTGIVWEIPSWRAPPSQLVNGDESSDAKEISQSASNSKANESSIGAESNSGDVADPMILSTPAASSPAPALSALPIQA